MEDYLNSYDVGLTSNINGEIGLINIPSARILPAGNLKLHLVNAEPINSMMIIANPFDWMEVSLRYTDVNLYLYSDIKAFSGNQTYKDKSFSMKLNLIEESDRFPALSLGFRDFIGTGKFSGEYLVSSKKIGDFDFTVGLGWGNISHTTGIENPFINLNEDYAFRDNNYSGKGGNFEFTKYFRGEKVSSFYGFEYLNKRSGLRFKMDYSPSFPFNYRKSSDYSFGLAIPASRFIDLNIFKHRGTDLGFGISYKANYSKNIVKKSTQIPKLIFSEKDKLILKEDDEVFGGTLNLYLGKYGLFLQKVTQKDDEIFLTISQETYRNQNLATKRVIQSVKDILETRNISRVSINHQFSNYNTNQVSFSLDKFLRFLENKYSLLELRRHLEFKNFREIHGKDIFKGNINFPIYSWGISPNLKNHIGAPEAFHSGQIGVFFSGGVMIDKTSHFDATLSVSLYDNLDQLRLEAYSRLPKVRSDIREYLKSGQNSIARMTFTKYFDPLYLQNGSIISGFKIGLFEEMYGGAGIGFLYKDVTKPWYLTADFNWVKQRSFDQRFDFRKYETFTGHLKFVWNTPLDGVRLSISGGRYLARDNGFTINLAKSFKSGFTLGFFATRTDISVEEFGEGSFDKGIFFSIPLDLVSKSYRTEYAKFVWRNLTRDGGALLYGGINFDGYAENKSRKELEYILEGLNL